MFRLPFSRSPSFRLNLKRRRQSFRRLACEKLENRLLMAVGSSAGGLGDFNGDGYGDLAIGAPFGAAGGEVNVIYGSATGLTTINNQLWSQSSSGILDSSESGDQFGAALAAGDFNHDGYGDLVVGVPNEKLPNEGGVTALAGAVNVLYGSSSGLTAAGNQFWYGGSPGIDMVVRSGDTTGDKFGASLAVGDFDNDNYADLAIGIPERFTTNVGAALILYGSATGLSSTGRQVWSQETPGVPDTATAGDLWASALAAGDFDHNGSDDLAIGATGEDAGGTDAGAVTILYGRAGIGLSAAGTQFWGQFRLGGSTAQGGDHFGAALAAGDFNGDNFADLAVGVPGERVGAGFLLIPPTFFPPREVGAVNVIYGAAGGLSESNDQFLAYGGFEDDLFGRALAAGDFNADGRDDLAIGIPLYGTGTFGGPVDRGAVQLHYGTSSGLFEGLTLTQDDLGGVSFANEYFGSALATADFNGDGRSDLAVGAPGLAGGVNVSYGSGLGLTGANNQFFSQNTTDILGVTETGERFGQALAGSSATGGAGFSGAWANVVQKPDRTPYGPIQFHLQGDLDVFNPGTETAARSVVRFFLSDDAVLDANDILLSESHLGPLKSQETRRVRFNATLKTSASGKFLIAVLDADNAVTELNELNNIIVFGPIP